MVRACQANGHAVGTVRHLDKAQLLYLTAAFQVRDLDSPRATLAATFGGHE